MQPIKIANDPRLAAKREQLTHLLKLMAGGAGVGMFGRSLVQFAKRPTLEVPFVSPGPSTLPIPVAVEEEQPGLKKLAGAVFDAVASMIPDGLDPATEWLGRNVSKPTNAPLMYPLSFAAAAGGVGGGWALTDWYLQRRRKQKMQQELERAKGDFQSALLDQSRASRAVKQADDQLGRKLDQLFDLLCAKEVELRDELEKTGNFADTAAKFPGLYLTAMTLLGAGSAYGMYNWTKKRSPSHVLQRAIRERGRALWSRSPQGVQVIPTPVTVPHEEEQPMAA